MSGRAQRDAAADLGAPESARIPTSVDEFLASLAGASALGALLGHPAEEQVRQGYAHTLREIAQQPVTWIETASRMHAVRSLVEESVASVSAVVFTGSGSSVYAAECVAPFLQRALGVPVTAVPAGLILTHPESCLPRAARSSSCHWPARATAPKAAPWWTSCWRSGLRRVISSSPATATGPSQRPTATAPKCVPSCSTSGRTTAAW